MSLDPVEQILSLTPQQSDMTDTMSYIPEEILTKIILYLDPDSIVNLCTTSSFYQSLCQSKEFWEHYVKTREPQVYKFIQSHPNFMTSLPNHPMITYFDIAHTQFWKWYLRVRFNDLYLFLERYPPIKLTYFDVINVIIDNGTWVGIKNHDKVFVGKFIEKPYVEGMISGLPIVVELLHLSLSYGNREGLYSLGNELFIQVFRPEGIIYDTRISINTRSSFRNFESTFRIEENKLTPLAKTPLTIIIRRNKEIKKTIPLNGFVIQLLIDGLQFIIEWFGFQVEVIYNEEYIV